MKLLAPDRLVRGGPRPGSRVLQRLDALDLALYRRAASASVPVLDRLLPRLTRAADHGLLWVGVSAALAASGGDRRRAAVRGLSSLAVASATANIPAKLSTRRTRPELHPVPVVRHLRRQPTTSSFPSGHSASAAAFATGVALEQPLLAIPIALAGAGVAYGRVHTGVHYPGDVLAGITLGVVGALTVRRAWPVRPRRPAVTPPLVVRAPALPTGEGLTVVVNTSAGGGERVEPVTRDLAELLPDARLVLVPGSEVDAALREAARTATVLGVAGGDGTVNTAAGIALEAGLPLAVVPGGTLDHFAGELGVRGVPDLAAAVREGSAVDVTVGSAAAKGDGLYFLNTFALGVYPELVRERERREGAIGKWPAMAVAMARTVRQAQPVHLEVDGQPRTLWTLFAGNGHYHPAGFAPSWRERLDDGTIDVRVVDASKPFARTRLVLAVLTGRLGRSRVHEQRIVAKLPVRSRQGGLRLARDGEVADGPGHLLLRAASRPLVVYRPAPP
ncbi:MAG TPA: phosphatase PAP2 family protein [Mycobacteriales bacterium]|nr:phosphatase PAP2 family protein [Mycobacteriales bacterium]